MLNSEQPKSVVNLKNVPDADRTMWVTESMDEIAAQIESGWVTVHRMHGIGNYEEYRVLASHVVSYTVLS